RKLRRSIDISVMAGQAIDRCLPLRMAVHAKAHRVVDRAARDRHLGDVALAFGAINARPYVWSVIEANVRLLAPPVHPLPRRLLALLEICGELLDGRLVCRHLFMAAHAQRCAWETRNRAFGHAVVAVVAFQPCSLDVHRVRVGEGLCRFWPESEEMIG